MTPEERRVIVRVNRNLSGLREALIGTNLRLKYISLLQADIDRMKWSLNMILEEDAPHADD